MSEKTTGRGRPAVLDKTTLAVGDEKITLTLVQDGRVQVSLPGSWVVAGLTAASGRKRLDVVPMNGTSERMKKATPKPVSAAQLKAVEKAAGTKAKAPKAKATKAKADDTATVLEGKKSVARKPRARKPLPAAAAKSEEKAAVTPLMPRSRRRRAAK